MVEPLNPKHLTPAERAKVQALNPEQRMQFDERVAICVEGGVQEHRAEWVAFTEICLAHAGIVSHRSADMPAQSEMANQNTQATDTRTKPETSGGVRN